MAIPPQFLKNVKSKSAKAEDAKDGGKDDANEDSKGNLKKKPSFKGAPKRDSKDPKGATADLIPSGPMKGKNPNALVAAKRNVLLQQSRGGK